MARHSSPHAVLFSLLAASLVRRVYSQNASKVISYPPSQYWEGTSGGGVWSSFNFQLGTPAQNVRLLPATGGTSIWAVIPPGCISDYGDGCADNRGKLYLSNESSTWDQIGLYDLNLFTEHNLGYYGNAVYGFETVTLGAPGDSLPTLKHQVTAGIAVSQFWLGTLPLEPWPVNFTSMNDPQPGLLTSLKTSQDIESLSWAYTAGANGRSPQVFGSLTLGGYDVSRFTASGVTFSFGGDISRDLLIPVSQIQMSNGFRYSQNQFYFIDSLVPDLWLPDAACTVFEKAFSLKLDNETGLYLVSDSLHQQLLGQNNNVTFTIGPGTDPTTGQSSDKTFEITMPYWAFDLQADFPLTPNKTNYFPLRRASSNSTQYTLGRAFLQAAYVIADYESQNFSVNAAKFPEQGAKENLVQIPGKLTQTQSSGNSKKSSSLSGGAIAGIAIGAVAAIAIIALAAFFIWRKKRRAQHMPAEKDERSSDPPAQTADPYGLRQEMDANPEAVPPALVGGMQRPKAPYSEVDGSESSLHEAPTSGGAMSEMEGSDPKYGPPRGPPRIHHNVFEMDTGQHNAQEMETPVHTPKSTPAGSPISRPGQQLGAGTSASGGAPSPLGPGSATSHSPGGTSPMGRSPRSPAAGPNIR